MVAGSSSARTKQSLQIPFAGSVTALFRFLVKRSCEQSDGTFDAATGAKPNEEGAVSVIY